jgi:hypothetical protein
MSDQDRINALEASLYPCQHPNQTAHEHTDASGNRVVMASCPSCGWEQRVG